MGATREEQIRADLDAFRPDWPERLLDYPSVLAYFADAQRSHDRLRPEVAADRFLDSWQHNPAWRRLGAARYSEFYTATRAIDMTEWQSYRDVLFIGLGDAVERSDFSALTAAVDSFTRLHVIRSLHSHSSLDHSFQFFSMLEAFATRDLGLVKEVLPAAAGLSANNYPLYVVGTNLVWTTLHGSSEQRGRVIERAEKYVATKSHPMMEKKIVAYLLEVARGDVAAASTALAVIDADWVKSRWLDGRRGGVLMRFAPMLHGLFLLGVELLPNGAAGLMAPKSAAFWPEYDEHVRSADWTRPAPALEFVGEIASLAQIYAPFDGGAPTIDVLPDVSFPDEYFPPQLLPFRPGTESRERVEAAKPVDPFLVKLLQGSRPAGEL